MELTDPTPPKCPTCGLEAKKSEALKDENDLPLNRIRFACAKRHRWVMELTSDGPKVVDHP